MPAKEIDHETSTNIYCNFKYIREPLELKFVIYNDKYLNVGGLSKYISGCIKLKHTDNSILCHICKTELSRVSHEIYSHAITH